MIKQKGNTYKMTNLPILSVHRHTKLCMVGLTAGAAQGALTNLVARKKKGRLSVTTPAVSNNALGYGTFLGIYANLRYQLLCGFDRAMVTRFDVIGVDLSFSTALRIMNA
nr:protein reticulata-related 1, chloroplastic-like [Tanacetum cinerariifolium]